MPSKTRKQAVKMAIACKHPDKATGKQVPQDVACEFNRADKGTGILKGKKSRR